MCSAKTPVSILQELLQKDKLIPEYTQVSCPCVEVGPNRQVFFAYRVVAGPVVGYGEGPSKKIAKHEAAKEALVKYTGLGLHMPDPDPNESMTSPQSSLVNVNEEFDGLRNLKINAVGMLEAFTTERNLPDPEYTLIADVGPAHKRNFTMECSVGSVRRTATELTKKKAKQSSAYEVYQCLLTFIPEPNLLFPVNYTTKLADYPATFIKLMQQKNVTFDELWRDLNLDMNMNLDLDENVHLDVWTENNLEIFLKKLDLTFTIECFDNFIHNFLFILIIRTEPIFCVCKMADKRETALPFLLRDAFSFLKVMTTDAKAKLNST